MSRRVTQPGGPCSCRPRPRPRPGRARVPGGRVRDHRVTHRRSGHAVGHGRQDRDFGRPPGRTVVRPRPAEIWWANVPYEGGPGGIARRLRLPRPCRPDIDGPDECRRFPAPLGGRPGAARGGLVGECAVRGRARGASPGGSGFLGHVGRTSTVRTSAAGFPHRLEGVPARPAEVWWANVPYEGGPGGHRPAAPAPSATSAGHRRSGRVPVGFPHRLEDAVVLVVESARGSDTRGTMVHRDRTPRPPLPPRPGHPRSRPC